MAASAAKAELGALFVNAKRARVMRLVFLELGHTYPPTPIYTDNTAAVGIVNSTIKGQRSKFTEVRYFWLLDQPSQQYFKTSRVPYTSPHRPNTNPCAPLLPTHTTFANSVITCSPPCCTARVY